jgi:esterase/lipase superfamily enzyme
MAGEGDKGVEWLRIYYATNRDNTGAKELGKRYGFTRAKTISYGAVDVTLEKQSTLDWLKSAAIFRFQSSLDPTKQVRLHSIIPFSQDRWRNEVANKARELGGKGILLFVHGYNVSFEDAALRSAQLSMDLAFQGASVFFAWPSRASLKQYAADQKAAIDSVPDLKRVIIELTTIAAGAPVYIVAHSMGNEVLVRALKDFWRDEKNNSRTDVLKEVVLTAPDVNAEEFERDAQSILKDHPRFTLYASANDRALMLSRQLSGTRRLGDADERITVLPLMETIDASTVKTDFLGHSYYGDSATLLSDLFYLIRTGFKPDDRFRLVSVKNPVGVYWRFK